jgi:hypothetical protein
MPLYYFHCYPDRDTEGVDLPNDATAREQAREAFGAMIQQGNTCTDMEVVDEQGRPVVRLSLIRVAR